MRDIVIAASAGLVLAKFFWHSIEGEIVYSCTMIPILVLLCFLALGSMIAIAVESRRAAIPYAAALGISLLSFAFVPLDEGRAWLVFRLWANERQNVVEKIRSQQLRDADLEMMEEYLGEHWDRDKPPISVRWTKEGPFIDFLWTGGGTFRGSHFSSGFLSTPSLAARPEDYPVKSSRVVGCNRELAEGWYFVTIRSIL